ncbi:MAG: ArnT family glycosyltransferase, partial [Gemmatimonadales bacterium]
MSTSGSLIVAAERRDTGWQMSDTRRLLLVTLAALALFTYGLGVGTLWDQDEPKYVQVAREILETGDLFTLRLDGQPWFVHPPLFMWLQAITGILIGFTEFAARIWSAISGAAIVAATFLLARLLYGSTTAMLAAAIVATSFQVLGQSRLAVFDPTLVAFMLLALYMYLVAYTTRSRSAHLWAWMWAGWATATKGPIGVLLPAMAIVGLWVVRREWRRWQEIPWQGPLIFAAVGLPWYIVETVRHGEVFLRDAVGYYLFNRFFGVVENQPGAWWYYVPVLLLGAFPWTACIPSTAAWLLRRRSELASQVILLWCGVTIVFYSVAGTKLPNYV